MAICSTSTARIDTTSAAGGSNQVRAVRLSPSQQSSSSLVTERSTVLVCSSINYNMDAWQPIGRTSNQVILYHRPSNVLSVQAYTEEPISIQSVGPSRDPSSSNLPVLARSRPQNGGNVVLGRRSSTVVATRQRRGSPDVPPSELCPYCYRPMSKDDHVPTFAEEYDAAMPPSPHLSRSSAQLFPITNDDHTLAHPRQDWNPTLQDSNLRRIGPYFQILEQSVDGSRASTPIQERDTPEHAERQSRTPNVEPQRSIEGYYHRFFIEEKRLGMGAEGSVFLCQVRFLPHLLLKPSLNHSSARVGWQLPRPLRHQKGRDRELEAVSVQDLAGSEVVGAVEAPEYHSVSSCMDRGCPILEVSGLAFRPIVSEY